jgi:hypothetical protein
MKSIRLYFERSALICSWLDRANNLESKKLGLAEERADFAERHVKFLERSNAEKAKKIEVLEKETEVLEKKYEGVLALNSKEYDEAQHEVRENWNQYHTCWFHYLDLLHLCNGKLMDGHPGANKPHQAAAQVRL